VIVLATFLLSSNENCPLNPNPTTPIPLLAEEPVMGLARVRRPPKLAEGMVVKKQYSFGEGFVKGNPNQYHFIWFLRIPPYENKLNIENAIALIFPIPIVIL